MSEADRVEFKRRCAIVAAKMAEDGARAKAPPVVDRKMTKTERTKNKPGRFWARSCAGWYLNSRYVVGSGAYRVTHGG